MRGDLPWSPDPTGGDGIPPLHIAPARLLSNIFTIRLTVAIIVFAIAAAIAFAIPQYSLAVRVGIAAATFSFLAIVLTQMQGLRAPFGKTTVDGAIVRSSGATQPFKLLANPALARRIVDTVEKLAAARNKTTS